MLKRLVFTLCLVSVMVFSATAFADSVTFTGSSGSLAASATFTISPAGTLTIVLSNTAAASSVNAPSDILSGLFFSLTGGPTLTPVSATSSSTASIANATFCNDNPCSGTSVNVGGEWSYAQGGLTATTNEGISSSGYLNNNTSAGNFNGLDLQKPVALDGIEFGIVPTGYVDGQGNGGVTNQALIRNSATFVLTGLPTNLTVANNIGNVLFTYGTSFSPTGGEPNFPGVPPSGAPVPEPSSILLLGTGLAGLAFWGRAKAQKQS